MVSHTGKLMKKSHILKKKERRLIEKLGPVTEENADTYPLGNPYRKTTKAELKAVGEWINQHKLNNPLTPEEIEEFDARHSKYIAEAERLKYLEQKRRVRKLFFKD